MACKRIKFGQIGIKLMSANMLILLVLLIMVAVSVFNFYAAQLSLDKTRAVYVPQITLANEIKETVLKQHVTVQGYISSPSLDAKNSYRKLERQFEQAYEALQVYILKTDDRELADQFKYEHDNFTEIANNVFSNMDKNRPDLVRTLLENYAVSVSRVVESSDELSSRYAAELDDSIIVTSKNIDFSLRLMGILTVIAFIGAVLITMFLTRRITKPLLQITNVSQAAARGDLRQKVSLRDSGEIGMMADAFNSMLENLNRLIQAVLSSGNYLVKVSEDFRKQAAISSLASGDAYSVLGVVMDSSLKQAEHITSILLSADSVATSIERINQRIQMINGKYTQMMLLADKGKSAIDEGIKKMEVIERTRSYLAMTFADLNTYIKQIKSVINLMENFSEQTNMVAINASIEAARYGEDGRGFAVVAKEIRKLADESSNSLEQIRQLTLTIEQKSAYTSHIMEASRDVVETGSQTMLLMNSALNEINVFVHETLTESYGLVSESTEISEHAKHIVGDIKDLEVFSIETRQSVEKLCLVINEQNTTILEVAASLDETTLSLEKSTKKFRISSLTSGEKK